MLAALATVAMNGWVAPVSTVIEDGETVTDTGRGVMVTVASAKRLGSATLVARTTALPVDPGAV